MRNIRCRRDSPVAIIMTLHVCSMQADKLGGTVCMCVEVIGNRNNMTASPAAKDEPTIPPLIVFCPPFEMVAFLVKENCSGRT